MDRGSRILIAGCGYVGGTLARMLVQDGHTVYALRRGSASPIPGVTPIRADLTDSASLRGLPASIDEVVFAGSPSSPDEQGYRRIFLEGLGNLIDALASRRRPPCRLVFTSSTAVYAQSDGSWVDETSETRPRSFRGRILLEAEAKLHESTMPGSVLRLGGIYGPGRSSVIERVRGGEARIAPGAPHYTNRIHRDDAAGAIRHLLSLDRVEPVYVGVDCRPADEGEILRFLAGQLGLPEPLPAAPDQQHPPRRAGSKRVRNARLLASGYRFRYPTYREGFAALLAELNR